MNLKNLTNLLFILLVGSLLTPDSSLGAYASMGQIVLSFEDRVEGDYDMNDAVFTINFNAKSSELCTDGVPCSIAELNFIITPMVSGAMDELELRFNPFYAVIKYYGGNPSDYQYGILHHGDSTVTKGLNDPVNFGFTSLYSGNADFYTSGTGKMANIEAPYSSRGKTRVFTFVFDTDCSNYTGLGTCSSARPKMIFIGDNDQTHMDIASFFHLENCTQNRGYNYPYNGVTSANGVIMLTMQTPTNGSSWDQDVYVPPERVSVTNAFNLSASCDLSKGYWYGTGCEAEIETAITNGSMTSNVIFVDPDTSSFAQPTPTLASLFEANHAAVHEVRLHDDFIDVVTQSEFAGGGETPSQGMCAGL